MVDLTLFRWEFLEFGDVQMGSELQTHQDGCCEKLSSPAQFQARFRLLVDFAEACFRSSDERVAD